MSVHVQLYEAHALAEVSEVELMATDDLLKRHYNSRTVGGKKYMQRRVRAFRREKLIEVLRVTLNTPNGPRKLPNVIRLFPKGADVVEDLLGYRPPRIVRSEPPTLVTLHHRVGVTRFLLRVKDACQHERLPTPTWILEQDMAPGAKRTNPLDQQFVLYERFVLKDGRHLTCRPDAAAAIQLPGTPTPTLLAYLEYDRSTDKKEQIERKVLPYRLLLDGERRPYKKHWPNVENEFARVLFVAKSRDRIDNVCDWIRGIPGAKLFRFAVERELDREMLRKRIWRTVTGDLVSIIK